MSLTGKNLASWCTLYRSKTWYVGVSTIFSLSVRISDCSTLMVWARLAILTRSQWLLKILRLVAASNASRKLFCWYRKPGLVPGSTSVHIPHSSTTRATFLSGSYLSMMAECLVTSSSIFSVLTMVLKYSFSSKLVADPLCPQLPVGTV